MPNNPDKPVVWINVPLSLETADMLHSVADMCHSSPQSVAASILHDVLKDDATAHRDEDYHFRAMPVPSSTIN